MVTVETEGVTTFELIIKVIVVGTGTDKYIGLLYFWGEGEGSELFCQKLSDFVISGLPEKELTI